MRITILCTVESPGAKPDVVVPQVRSALRKGGHTVSVLPIHKDLRTLINGIRRQKPDLLFNLLESFGDNPLGDVGLAGVLELLEVPFTACGPGEQFLSQDKAISKKMLAFEGLLYPKFALFARDASLETGGNLRLPLFVKPVRMDASIGIDARSLVHDAKEMMRRVTLIHEKAGDDALCEEYIEGREFYVGVLGNREPRALPVVEMDFSGMPEGMPHILDQKAKFQENSREFKGTRSVIADIPEELTAKLQKVSLDAYRALKVRDYGRVDLRYTESGEIYVLEVNSACYLVNDGEFAQAAGQAGIDYVTLVNRIAELAMERHRMSPKVPLA